MPSQYIPILLFASLAAAFPGVTLVLYKADTSGFATCRRQAETLRVRRPGGKRCARPVLGALLHHRDFIRHL